MSSSGIEAVRAWILARNPGRDDVGSDENILESRLVDSLSFVDLVYTIEAAADVEIDLDTIRISDFETISTIEKTFFSGSS